MLFQPEKNGLEASHVGFFQPCFCSVFKFLTWDAGAFIFAGNVPDRHTPLVPSQLYRVRTHQIGGKIEFGCTLVARNSSGPFRRCAPVENSKRVCGLACMLRLSDPNKQDLFTFKFKEHSALRTLKQAAILVAWPARRPTQGCFRELTCVT